MKIVKGEGGRIHESVVIGELPFTLQRKTLLPSMKIIKRRRNITSKGGITIGDNVDIGAGTVIQCGRTRHTHIDDHTYINMLCGIGHDVKIGKGCVIGMGVKISGYAEIGDNVQIDPDCYITNRVKIGDNSRIRIGSLVIRDIPSNSDVVGRPAIDFEEYRMWRSIRRKLIEINQQ